MKATNKKRRKKKSKQTIKPATLAVLFVIILISGYYIAQIVHQNFFNQVDIVLDAGHGGNDPGAVHEDVLEKEITLEITRMTKELLKESGYTVGMTRNNDSFIELGERATYATRRNAKVFISIHCNASENSSGNGIETFYSKSKELNNNILAEMIQNAVIEQTEASNRGIKTENYTVLVRSNMPAALIEVGFITNETEKELLQDPSYQQKLAKGISEGIIRYMQR